jgi:hypothetical protein
LLRATSAALQGAISRIAKQFHEHKPLRHTISANFSSLSAKAKWCRLPSMASFVQLAEFEHFMGDE